MKKDIRSLENNWFERIVSVSLILVFSLVLVTGILSFIKLNGIIYTIDDIISPNKSINMIKEIFNDLMQAENHVKAYNLTGNRADLESYNGLIITTGAKVKDLKALVESDKIFAPYADTLEALTEKKFEGLDMLVIIKDTYPVKEAIQGFMLDVSGEIFPPVLTDSVDSGTLEQMAQKIRKATKDALTEEYTRSELEQEWTDYDRFVTDRLRAMIGSLDLNTAKYIKEHSDTVEQEASKVRLIILIFGIASAILLILAGIVIFLYVRRNKEYRQILKKARADAEELARARQQFLANMSHEIRTPMNIISGYLDQILKEPLEPGLGEQIGIVRKSSDHLLELLNNLLDLSRLQARKLDLIREEFSPNELIRDMHLWFTPAAVEKNLHFTADADPEIPSKLIGDPVRLRQILFNLISNAIKYTDNGSVSIIARPGPADPVSHRIVFEVTDTGAGISSDDKEKIFSEFTRGAIAVRKSEGSGLGLNITFKLVELMEGKLEVKSTPGKGSTFIVEIPFKAVNPEEVPANPDVIINPDRLKGLRILVADDDSYNRGLLRMILGKYQCRVIECSNGAEAIEVAADQDIDLVLLDMRMPGMSGPDAASELSRMFISRSKVVPIIALSAAITDEDKELLKTAGISQWLSKPFEEQKLISVILGLIPENGKVYDHISSPEINTLLYEDTSPFRESSMLDLDALRKSCNGNQSFFKEMVTLFIENTQTGLKDAEAEINSGSMEEASAIAHRISASCKHLRAGKLYTLLKALEEQAGSGQKEAAMEILGKANEEFDLIRNIILAEPEFKTS